MLAATMIDRVFSSRKNPNIPFTAIIFAPSVPVVKVPHEPRPTPTALSVFADVAILFRMFHSEEEDKKKDKSQERICRFRYSENEFPFLLSVKSCCAIFIPILHEPSRALPGE